jgi:hypothetical protein
MIYNPNMHYGMADVRRWAFYNIGAMMGPTDTGVLHGPQQWLEASPAATKRLNAEQDRLFAPVDVMAGQLGMEL